MNTNILPLDTITAAETFEAKGVTYTRGDIVRVSGSQIERQIMAISADGSVRLERTDGNKNAVSVWTKQTQRIVPVALQPEVADMTEAFAADEEADARAEILAQITEAAGAGDNLARNAKIREARDLKIRRVDIATAAGISANYLQHILNPQGRRPSLTKFQQGYQEALADLAAVMAYPDGGVLSSVEEWIQANRAEVAA